MIEVVLMLSMVTMVKPFFFAKLLATTIAATYQVDMSLGNHLFCLFYEEYQRV